MPPESTAFVATEISEEKVIENPPEIAEPNSTIPPHDIDAEIADLTSRYEGFDPALHAVDKLTGEPKRRGDGSFALKRGRKPGAQVRPEVASGQTRAPVPPGQPAPVFAATPVSRETVSNDEAARQVCNLAISACVAIFGPEWAPESKEEGKALQIGVKNYFDAKGQIQLSPEWGLAFAVLAYAGPRMRHENTRTKVKKIGYWVKDKIIQARMLFNR